MDEIKFVIDSNHNNTEIPADPHEEQALSVKVIAVRSKAKAKLQRREPVD